MVTHPFSLVGEGQASPKRSWSIGVRRMGTFSVPVEVGNVDGSRYESLEALVDTGASYLVVPRSVLSAVGVRVAERRQFTLADGRQVEMDVGAVSLRLDGRSFPVLAVFGGDEAGTLLGAVALETFGLAADPIRGRLVPVAGLLMSGVGWLGRDS